MSKFVIFHLCAVFVLVSPHPLLQRYPQQCQCPVYNYPQSQLLNIPLDFPHQHIGATPQAVTQACNTPTQPPHQCIPVRDQENQQFLGKIFENTLIKALQKQNGQQYQSSVQNSGHQPHVVNNYFIIPTEALLGDEDSKSKKEKAKHGIEEEKNNKEHNKNNKSSKEELSNETRSFLDEYLNKQPPKRNQKPHNADVSNQKAAEPLKCFEDEQPIEVELEPTFAKIQEHPELIVTKVPTQVETDEAVIQDVRYKFPNMPEPLVRSLVSVIKPRIQRTNPYQNHRYPYRQRLTHEHANSTIEGRSNNWHHRPGQRHPLRRNPHRRRKGSDKNTTVTSDVEGTTKKCERLDLPKATQVEPTVTESYKTSESTSESPKKAEYEDVNKSNEIKNTTPYIVYASHHDVELPELGFEDIIPNIGNGINDDYYPYFVNDNKAHPTNDAINYPEFYDEVLKSERKLNNAREIQRSKILDGKKTPKKAIRRLFETQRKDKNERKHEEKSEEIVYRIPPGLDSPDFKTVNVREYHNSNYQRPTYFSHEVDNTNDNNVKTLENEVRSSNNEPVITYYLPSKSMDANTEKPTEKLETVFANSKIVNYGHVSDGFDAETTTIANMFSVDFGNHDGTKKLFDDKAVVMAKTIVESEEFDW